MPVPGELPPNPELEGPIPAVWGSEGSTCPGDKAGLEDIVSGEGEADGAPRFALHRLVLDDSEKAANAPESKKDEIYRDCCLAEEEVVVGDVLPRLPGASPGCPGEQRAAELLDVQPLRGHRAADPWDCCEFRKRSVVDAFSSVYIGLKDKLSQIRDLLDQSDGACNWTTQPSHLCPPTKDKERFPQVARDNDTVTNAAPWEQLYPGHPKGFEHRCQVMSDNSLYFSGYYFEVEISGADMMYLGMMYRSIDQVSSESNSCTLGNNFSRRILRNGKGFSAWHSDVEMPLKMAVFDRIGVYPNYPSRTLSFYRVTYDDMTLMYQFEYDFVEPLYLEFWLLKRENCQDNVTGEDAEEMPAFLPSFGDLIP